MDKTKIDMQELEKLKKILEKIKVPKELYKLSTYLFLRYTPKQPETCKYTRGSCCWPVDLCRECPNHPERGERE